MTIQDLLSLFPGATREKPKFMALAGAVLGQVTDMLPLIAQLQSGFSVAYAEGKQLDQIANAIGLSRNDIGSGDASDEEFRQYIRAKLALWSWDGTNKTVPAVLADEGITKMVTDRMDLSVEISADGDAPAGNVFPVPTGYIAVTEEQEEPE